jgi:hypothetical protein
MAIRRKGSRAIVVRGKALRFAVFRKGVRGCPDCDRLHVVITDDDRAGSVVQLHVGEPSGPDVAITPGIIAAAAEQALDAGWQPGHGNGVFLRLPTRGA